MARPAPACYLGFTEINNPPRRRQDVKVSQTAGAISGGELDGGGRPPGAPQVLDATNPLPLAHSRAVGLQAGDVRGGAHPFEQEPLNQRQRDRN